MPGFDCNIDLTEEDYDRHDLIPNNYGDYLCVGITEKTEQEDSDPDYYEIKIDSARISIGSIIFGKFVNNENYYVGH